ncbi:pentatricopeptide repeat-containing protein At4g30825, chloroplastic-like [Papaver somniferum]|nr:pentatricopeptide repeat-containing protein At4g30825, chloroplastic-like [Papaver somniferum]
MSTIKICTSSSELHESQHKKSNLLFINSFPSCCVHQKISYVKQFRVCRLSSTDSIDTTIDMNDEIIRKKERRNLWMRYRGVKKLDEKHVLRDEKKKPSFVYKYNNGVIDDALESSVDNVSMDSTVGHCNSILKQLECCNDDKALSFFEWMRINGKLKDNVVAYNVALKVLGRKEDWMAAEGLLQQVISDSGSPLSFQVFNTLIYACFRKGYGDLATKWFRLMLENGVQPNVATFGMLMSLYQKSANVADAEFAFEKMRGFKLQCQSAYSAMITIYTRLGLYDKSEEIIGFIKEDRVVPNLENWLVQLNAYSQQGKLVEAEGVLKEMREAGTSPNIVAYNTLITGYGRVSNMDAAQLLFHNLANVGLEADETSYRSMVEGWGRANNYKETKWYYEKLKEAGFKPNSSNFFTIINLQVRNKDDEGVIATLNDMRRMGCQYSSIISSVVQAYEKVRRVNKVPLVLRGSFYSHVLVDPTSCSILVMAYVKHQLVDDVLQILKEKKWKDNIFEDNLYHLLICSCKESDHREDAVRIFTQMPTFEGDPNLHIACTMIDIYGFMGRFNEAKDLYLKLKSSGIALDMVTYSVVVRMYVKSGSLKEASLVLYDMEKQKEIVPDVFLFRDMLRIYQQCRMQQKLEEIYYQILKSGIAWDQEMYNCVINCCSRALPVDELSRVFDEMLQRGYAPNTITVNVMLDMYGKARLFKKAKKVFWMARKRGLTDVISYNTIIAAYGRNKDLKNMKTTVKKMEFHGFSVSLEAYNCMLDAYGKEGEMEKFRDVLRRLKESSVVSDHYTYNILINIYGEKGWIEEVAEVLEELQKCGLGPDLCGYNTLIKAYGLAGMVEKAVALVKEMRDSGIEPDQITYSNLIAALQKNDNFLEAVKWSLWMKQTTMETSRC